MKEQIQRSKSQESQAISSQPQAANQAPLSTVLQRYQMLVQRKSVEEEEDVLQGKFADVAQREESSSPLPNNTGLPDNLKSGIENLSGYNMDDVKVHYNSSKPAQLQALAYTQGTDIHVAPGQEKHLPHEAWHVVQQKQGRVQPTMQLKGVNVNDDEALEREADVMGKCINNKRFDCDTINFHNSGCKSSIIQRIIDITFDDGTKKYKVEVNHRPAFDTKLHPQVKGHTRNHVISIKNITALLVEILEKGLNSDRDAGTNTLTSLGRLVKAIIPEKEEQYAEAIAYTSYISEELNNTSVSDKILKIKAYVNQLEYILNNSKCNLRLGDSAVNKSINSNIDPLPDSVSLNQQTGEISIKDSRFEKQMHKLLRLKREYPEVEIDGFSVKNNEVKTSGKEGKGVIDLDGHYSPETGSKPAPKEIKNNIVFSHTKRKRGEIVNHKVSNIGLEAISDTDSSSSPKKKMSRIESNNNQ